MHQLTSTQKRYLRGQGSLIRPNIFVGKNGLAEQVVKAIDEALDDHELIKVRFLEFKEEKKNLSADIEKLCNCEMVGMIGHVAVFFRRHSDPEKRKISLQ
jgi:RNA-binding protein